MENKNIHDVTVLLQAVRTGHYPTFALALAVAKERCALWRDASTGDRFGADALAGRTPALEGTAFYMVSTEGALGACPGHEWETRWLYLPITEADLKAEAEAKAKAEAEAKAQQAPVPPAEPAPKPRARFCPECGAPYKSDEARFCTNCGTPRK